MGLLYLQKGIRWIPSYKFVIDGKGGVTVQLEATLINELADLDDVTANLVVGVPSFAFADTADPIGMGQTVAQLSQYFQPDAQTPICLLQRDYEPNGRLASRANDGSIKGSPVRATWALKSSGRRRARTCSSSRSSTSR